MKFTATLIRGGVHYLGNKRFDRGVAVSVSASEKAHLEKTAVDTITAHSSNGRNEAAKVPRFEFAEIAEIVEAPESAEVKDEQPKAEEVSEDAVSGTVSEEVEVETSEAPVAEGSDEAAEETATTSRPRRSPNKKA